MHTSSTSPPKASNKPRANSSLITVITTPLIARQHARLAFDRRNDGAHVLSKGPRRPGDRDPEKGGRGPGGQGRERATEQYTSGGRGWE